MGPHIFDGYASDIAARAASCGPASVLELAAGTGIVTRKLRDALEPGCELVASDLNPPMLEVAKSKFGAEDEVSFQQVDATDIGFDDERFDLVVCQFGVMFFPDKDRSYREVLRVLKSGGHYLFNAWGSWEENPFARIAHEVAEAYFPDDPPGFYKVPFSYNDAKEIEAAVASAGFTDVVVERVPTLSKIQTARLFARGLVFGNPLFDEINSRGGDPEAMAKTLEEAIDKELGGEMPLQAVFVSASKP